MLSSEDQLLLQYAVKRKAVGIWGCKDCGKVKAGGAYTLKYFFLCPFLNCLHFKFASQPT